MFSETGVRTSCHDGDGARRRDCGPCLGINLTGGVSVVSFVSQFSLDREVSFKSFNY